MTERRLHAIIFDFDGTIVDSEAAEAASWLEAYAEVGLVFPVERWVDLIGRAAAASGGLFDGYAELEERTGQARSALRERRHHRVLELVHAGPLRPGVAELIDEASREGVRLAVASSAVHEWVDSHLAHRGLTHRFEAVVTAEDVGHIGKPAPDVFLEALRRLSLAASDALVIEDSPNGIEAAKAAHLFTIAVPNDLTRNLPMEGADLVLDSLAAIDLAGLRAAWAAQAGRSTGA